MKILCITSYNQTFKGKKLHPIDLAYKKTIQQGLKNTYNIKCEIEDLNSVVGPIELRRIINLLRPEDYIPGEDFRANFHIHTQASDGSLTPKLFLEQCKTWGNKISKTIKKDLLPPFTAAITDHDCIDSVKETLAIISQNPSDYKNFKFVTGCEFLFHGYKEPYSAFEAVGLGFNPFERDLDDMTKGRDSKNSVDDTKKILKTGGILSWAHPIVTPEKINDDFFSFLKTHGIDGIEGNYQYIFWNKDYVQSFSDKLKTLIQKYQMFVTGGTDTHSKSIFGR